MSAENLETDGYVETLDADDGRGGNYVYQSLECTEINTPITAITSGLTVTGATTLTSDLTIGGDLNAASTISVTGTTTVTNISLETLASSDAMEIVGTTTFSNVLNLIGSTGTRDNGTAGSDATAFEAEVGGIHYTFISGIGRAFDLSSPPGGQSGIAGGIHLYTFPSNSIIKIHSISILNQTNVPSASAGADITPTYGCGTTEASGDVQTLTTSTWKDLMSEKTGNYVLEDSVLDGSNTTNSWLAESGKVLDSGITSKTNRSMYFNIACDFSGATFAGIIFSVNAVCTMYIMWSILS